MAKDLYLMLENTPVLQVNFDEHCKILCKDLVPFSLQDKLYEVNINKVHTSSEIKHAFGMLRKDSDYLVSWLAHRVLLLTRKNAKKLYQAYCLSQQSTDYDRAKISIACRALNLSDNYWITLNPNIKWESVNVRHNSLSEAVAQIALHGSSLSVTGQPCAPEFTTGGSYAKAWHRDPDVSLWLYKLSDGASESEIEVMCSNILDCCNVAHCHYEARESQGLFVCACPSMTSDDISIMDGGTYISWCNRQGLNPDTELKKLDPDGLYKMFIVDYLIANRDRHDQNWGLYYKPRTMEILGLHPLFDHNNAFDIPYMQDEDAKSHFYEKSLKENAVYAMHKTDFHFTVPITRDMFITERQYNMFMKRAEQLGIKTQSLTKDDIYIQYGGFQRYKEAVHSLMPPTAVQSGDLELYKEALLPALKDVQDTHNCYR